MQKNKVKIDVFTSLFFLVKKENPDARNIFIDIKISNRNNLFDYIDLVSNLDDLKIMNDFFEGELHPDFRELKFEFTDGFGFAIKERILKFSRSSKNAHTIIENLQINAE